MISALGHGRTTNQAALDRARAARSAPALDLALEPASPAAPAAPARTSTLRDTEPHPGEARHERASAAVELGSVAATARGDNQGTQAAPAVAASAAPPAAGAGAASSSRRRAGVDVILEEDKDYEPTPEEIQEYAEWLGMKSPEDDDLRWIAREALKAPLPEHWKPCKTNDGEIYYFNFASGESVWDHPCDEYYKKLYEEEKNKKARGEA